MQRERVTVQVSSSVDALLCAHSVGMCACSDVHWVHLSHVLTCICLGVLVCMCLWVFPSNSTASWRMPNPSLILETSQLFVIFWWWQCHCTRLSLVHKRTHSQHHLGVTSSEDSWETAMGHLSGLLTGLLLSLENSSGKISRNEIWVSV